MNSPDFLDLAALHAYRWYEYHGLPTEPMLCIMAGEHGTFTRSASCTAQAPDRAALRRELRAEYAAAGVTQAFYLSVGQGIVDDMPFGPALFVVTYEKDQPDRGRVVLLKPDPRLGGALGWKIPADQVSSPFPNLLTGLHEDERQGARGLKASPR